MPASTDSMPGTPRRHRRLSAAAIFGAVVIALSVIPAPQASATGILIVDDDNRQCATAGFSTIAAAVAAAGDGDTIRVCPGAYREGIAVTTSVRIMGPVAAVRRLDCASEQPWQLDTDQFAVLDPVTDASGEATAPILSLDADRIDVSGLVFQNVLDDDAVTDPSGQYDLFVAALASTDAHSGYGIRSNAFLANTLAVEFGSGGAARSAVQHNCLRQNDYALANQSYALRAADITANTTFGTGVFAYEIGWDYRAASDVSLRGNLSRSDAVGIRIEDSARIAVSANDVAEWSRTGIQIADDNAGIDLTGNRISGGTSFTEIPSGIFFSPPQAGGAKSTSVTVRGNTASGLRWENGGRVFGLGINVGSGALDGARIVGNITSDNGQTGIVVQAGNRDNVIIGNTALDNDGRGIRIVGPDSTGNQLIGNRMTGNGVADAEDGSDIDPSDGVDLQNTWRGNLCVVDIPAGAIC